MDKIVGLYIKNRGKKPNSMNSSFFFHSKGYQIFANRVSLLTCNVTHQVEMNGVAADAEGLSDPEKLYIFQFGFCLL